MPISRCLHASRKAVVVTLSAPYSADDLRAALSAVFASPEFHECPRLLIDRTGVLAPASASVDVPVAAVRSSSDTLAQSRTAILVSDTTSFGTIRMSAARLQMRYGSPPLSVFRDEGEALNWLASP